MYMTKYATSNLYDTIYGGAKVMRGGNTNATTIVSLINNKKDFLVKIFAMLITQLGITYYIMTNYSRKNDKNKYIPKAWVLVLLSFILIIVLAFVRTNMYLKFGLFTAFSALTGFIFSELMQITSPEAVKVAVAGTLGIFVSMFLVGAGLLASGIEFGIRFGLVLLFSLIILIVFSLVSIFMTNYSQIHRYLTAIGLVLFSVYIVYDTNTILQKDYYGDFITASLDYYLDIINIFVRLLNYNRN